MDRQQQLALLQQAMESQHHTEEVNAANDKLRVALALRQATLQRLQHLSVATASLLNSVDSTSTQTEPSSLQILTKLPHAAAVDASQDPKDEDQIKAIVGKYLNQLLGLIVQSSKQGQQGLNVISMVDLELKLHQRFAFAEEHDIIPKTDDKTGWKKGTKAHQPLYEQIASSGKRLSADDEIEDTDE
jgi:hypothetical protein